MRLLIALVVQAGFLFSAYAAPKEASEFPQTKHMVETHIHLYDTAREGGVEWPPKSSKVLYKPHLPADFAKAVKGTGLTATVIVEASSKYEINKWVLDLVKGDDHYIGLVGNLDMGSESFEDQLKSLTKDTDRKCRFVGLRVRKRPDLTLDHPQFVKNLKILAKHDLSLDLLSRGDGPKGGPGVQGLQRALGFAKAVPELRIVVNHMGGYRVDGKPVHPEWAAAIEALAKQKNVWMKISGLFGRNAVKDVEYYRTVLDHLYKHFGPDRVIYGSNWPVTRLTGATYAEFVKVIHAYFSEKDQEAQEKYYWRNANEVYKLGLE